MSKRPLDPARGFSLRHKPGRAVIVQWLTSSNAIRVRRGAIKRNASQTPHTALGVALDTGTFGALQAPGRAPSCACHTSVTSKPKYPQKRYATVTCRPDLYVSLVAATAISPCSFHDPK